MTWAPTGRDSYEVDALVADRYLETLLAAHARGADAAPAMPDADPVLRHAMARLARDLPRFHPSFRFEEALADRLAAAAERLRAATPDLPTIPPEVQRMPPDAQLRVLPEAQLRLMPDAANRLMPDAANRPMPDATIRIIPPADLRSAMGRPLWIGGALTSAALSLAGAAWLAWRFRRPPDTAMARAVRAVARARLS